MRDDNRRQRASQFQPLEQQKQRNQIGKPRRNARNQDQGRGAHGVHLGNTIARRHANQQCYPGGAEGHNNGIPGKAQEIIARENFAVIVQCR
jgi:hypothetical protein